MILEKKPTQKARVWGFEEEMFLAENLELKAKTIKVYFPRLKISQEGEKYRIEFEP